MSGVQAIRHWKTRTPAGRCWVIALGTNDAAANFSPTKAQRIDMMVNELAGDKALWINVAMNSRSRPNYNGLNAFAWNTLLVDKGLTVFDWNKVAQPEWFSTDGFHYNTTGNKWRSAWIAYAAAYYLG